MCNSKIESNNSSLQEMKNLSRWYCRFLARYSGLVLVSISTLSVIAIICSLTLHQLPDFTDPQAGFETRGTEISRRLTAWENLLDSVSHVGPLTTNPIEAKSMLSRSKRSAKDRNKRKIKYDQIDEDMEYEDNSGPTMVLAEPVFSGYFQRRIGWLCGEPMPDYAHVVFRSKTNQSLFSWESIISMCTVDSLRLRSQPQFKELCETKGPAHCCPGWSLGGYIGLLHKRSSCFGIQKSDVSSTLDLLKRCSPFYHSGELTADCLNNPRPCIRVPRECILHNAVFTILHYLTDHDFMSTENVALNRIHLRYAMSFLPVARSSATLDYFYALQADGTDLLGDDRTEIVAMDLGLKETLFHEYLMEDAVYLLIALIFISLTILIYTQSMFITIATLLAITYALSLAYFIYTFVCGIKFFPFMNVLAAVIAIGVGADDTFILVKAWRAHSKLDPNLESLDEQLESMVHLALSHSLLTMCVTSFTTAAAFFASFISTITAIKCFSIFAGLAILCNLLLMVSWTPAVLVFYAKSCQGWLCCKQPDTKAKLATDCMDTGFSNYWKILTDLPKMIYEHWLPDVIIRFKFIYVIVLGSLIMGSIMTVFYFPKLKLPDKEQFQLFKASHIFEKYDLVYKRHFGFEKDEQADISYKMPLRFIWGIKPADQGSYLDPASKGQIEYDPTFDISSTDSQRWMLRFCEQVRKQPFFKPTLGPLLSNCFMETFKEWMKRRCRDEITDEDRAPCCQASNFPYTIPIFERCLVEAIGDLYATPTDFWRPGIAGPKFNLTTHKVEALIVEYDSNVTFSFSHSEMEAFYLQVNDWFNTVIQSAPPQLRSGFFLSHLGFFDVQNSLLEDTLSAIGLALCVAVIVVFASTFNVGLTLLTVLTITGVIFVSMAILVFMGWKLNILESVAITLAIGLSVDFTLHYAMMYRQAQELQDNKETGVLYSIRHMGGPVTMAALTTLIPGLCMLPSRVLAYVQIGSFIIVLMLTSWCFATFFFQAFLRILGPSALSISIPEETCCGQRMKLRNNQKRKKKKQRETWHQNTKVILDEEKQIDDNSVAGYEVNQAAVNHEIDLRNGEMKTFAVSIESNITQVSSNNTEVMTTIAAQVNPVTTTAEVLTTAAALSIDEKVFKNSSNLSEEDLQDGRVTLPYLNQDSSKRSSPTTLYSPLKPASVKADSPVKPSAPSLEIIDLPPPQQQQPLHHQGPQEIRKQQIFETALIHSDSPTIRADLSVCSSKSRQQQQPSESLPKKKVRRSGSSGTVIEFVPSDNTTVEIDLTDPEPKQSVIVDDITHDPTHLVPNVIQPAIRSIIKTKKTPTAHGRNAYHGYFYVEEHAPPPPPHAYEVQSYVPHQIVPMYPEDTCCTIYQDHLMNSQPIPLPRHYNQADLYDYPKNNSRIQELPPPEEMSTFDVRKLPPSSEASERKQRSKKQDILESSMSTQEQFDHSRIQEIGYDENNGVIHPIMPYQEPPPPQVPPHQNSSQQQQQQLQEEVMESVVASRRRRKSKQKSLGDEMIPIQQSSMNEATQQPPPTEEEVLSHVMCKARQTRSKSCHSRSNSLKRSRRKLAPDEDLITVVTDDHCHTIIPPQPKPRTSLGSKSGSLGNIIMSEQFLMDESDPFASKINRQTLPRSRHVQQNYDNEITRDPPKPTPRKGTNNYHRHPLSLSTETILFNDDKYDPNPIIPNRAPGVPDIWLPIKA